MVDGVLVTLPQKSRPVLQTSDKGADMDEVKLLFECPFLSSVVDFKTDIGRNPTLWYQPAGIGIEEGMGRCLTMRAESD